MTKSEGTVKDYVCDGVLILGGRRRSPSTVTPSERRPLRKLSCRRGTRAAPRRSMSASAPLTGLVTVGIVGGVGRLEHAAVGWGAVLASGSGAEEAGRGEVLVRGARCESHRLRPGSTGLARNIGTWCSNGGIVQEAATFAVRSVSPLTEWSCLSLLCPASRGSVGGPRNYARILCSVINIRAL